MINQIIKQSSQKSNTILLGKLLFKLLSTKEFDYNKPVEFFDLLLTEYLDGKVKEIPDIIEETQASAISEIDLRIKGIRIKNSKGYAKNLDQECFIDFLSESNEPSSAMIFGLNGTGKSTIYSCIEFLMTKEVSEYKLRKPWSRVLETGDYLKFFSSVDSKELPSVFLETKSGVFSVENGKIDSFEDRSQLKNYIKPFFLSENDLVEIGKLENDNSEFSIYRFIAERLGLSELIKLKDFLDRLATVQRVVEGRKINDNRRIHGELKDKNVEIDRLIEEKQKALTGIVEIKSATPESDYKDMPLADIEVMFTISKDYVSEYVSSYQLLQKLVDASKMKDELSFLSIGLQLIDKADNCPFCDASSLPTSEIKQRVQERITGAKNYSQQNDIVAVCFEDVIIWIQELESFYVVCKAFADYCSAKFKTLTIENQDQHFANLFEKLEFLRKSKYLEIINKFKIDDAFTPVKREQLFEIVKDLKDENIIRDIIVEVKESVKLIKVGVETYLKNKVEESSSSQISKSSIQSEIERLISQKLSNEKQMFDLHEEITKLVTLRDDVKNLKSELARLCESAQNFIADEIKSRVHPLSNSIKSILNNYLSEDDMQVQISFEKKINTRTKAEEDVITIKLQKKTGDPTLIEPKEYFNTFRYKLFCIMISMGLAISIKKKYAYNIPVVFDDVFMSSDFKRRSEFEEFFRKLLTLFYEFDNDLNTQFLVFTHDEVVYDSLLNILSQNHKGLNHDNTVFGKLQAPQRSISRNYEKNYNLLFRPNLELMNKIKTQLFALK